MRPIRGGMIGNSNYIRTSLNRLIREVKPREKKHFQFLKNNCINKNDRTSHWVGHSDLKYLDTNELFERKQIIEDMEAELTEAS